jgi:hypothetical protein
MSGLEAPQRSSDRTDRLLFGALSGLSVAVVLQLTDKNLSLDKLLWAALLCFSVALPLLVSSFLLELAPARPVKQTPRRLFDLTGVVLALAGFVLLFFHLDLLAGSIFLVSVVVCFIVVVRSPR